MNGQQLNDSILKYIESQFGHYLIKEISKNQTSEKLPSEIRAGNDNVPGHLIICLTSPLQNNWKYTSIYVCSKKKIDLNDKCFIIPLKVLYQETKNKH